MRNTIATIVSCLLTLAPGLDPTRRAAAQAALQPGFARESPGHVILQSTFGRTGIGSSLVPRSNPPRDADADDAHRIPLVAGVLGIIPGLGHVYAGEPVRGLIVAGIWFGSGLVAFSSNNTTVTGAGGVVLLGTSVFSVVDAVLAADRFNRRHASKAR